MLREVRGVYRLVSEAVMNLCDKFFEMDRTEASQALELYKVCGQSVREWHKVTLW